MKYVAGKCLLNEILAKAGMTQADLSVRTGISRSQINGYKRNRTEMTLSVAKTIAAALNCSIEDLYEWISKK